VRTALVPVALSMAGLLPASTLANASPAETIIVTAARSPERLDESLAPVTLITRADIERLQALDLPELLTGLPGMQFANSGGRGKSTSLFLRGTNSDHVLVLIDGVKVGSATTGTTAFEQLPVEQIERIEIVRGPRSSLYGSEALGGIIQIFTRRGGSAHSFGFGGDSEGGSHLHGGISGGSERGWFHLGISALETPGIDSRPSVGQPDRDGYWNVSGSARAGMRLGERSELLLSWLRARSENEFDSTAQNQSRNTQQVLGAVLQAAPLARWHTSLGVGRSLDDGRNFLDEAFSSRFVTHRDTASWQNDLTLTRAHTLSFGADYQRDRVGGTTAYDVDSRVNTGVFVQYHGRSGKHELQLSVRRDDNDQFGTHTTGGAAWGYRLSDSLRLTASHGTAFKAPTFNQLYFPGFGNPALQPESSRSTEIGLDGGAGAWQWGLSAFETRIEDLIVNTSVPAGLMPINIGRARIRGLELDAQASWEGWTTRGSVTLLDPVDRSDGAHDGHRLPRRARHDVRLEIDRQFPRLGIGATLHAVGDRHDDAANTRRLPGYLTVDLRLQYPIGSRWLLQARAANLFDERYETVATYAQPGRTVFLTVRHLGPSRASGSSADFPSFTRTGVMP